MLKSRVKDMKVTTGVGWSEEVVVVDKGSLSGRGGTAIPAGVG